MARLLMCPPKHFRIEYEINPWMRISNDALPEVAERQWQKLYEALTKKIGAQVELVEPVPGLPDLVFTANAGLVIDRRFIASNFRYPQRQREMEHFKAWFAKNGFEIISPPQDCYFEGEGDAFVCGDTIFAGYRFRSEICSHNFLAEATGKRVLSLELLDPKFYHLDTCFCPLGERRAAYYPPAFDEFARKVLEAELKDAIIMSEVEALRFACNAVVIDNSVILNTGCDNFAAALEERGHHVFPVDLTEFIKSGGSAKCLVLLLDR